MSLLIGDALAPALGVSPGALAVTLHEQQWTFAELDATATALAAGLQQAGLRLGDHLIWCHAPALRTTAAYLACARLGAVFVPLNPASTPDELAATVRLVRPRVIATDPARLSTLEEAAHRSGVTARVVRAGDLLASGAQPRWPGEIDERAAHIAYLTSGSTGTPKAVLVSHRASWLRSAPGGGTFAGGIAGAGGVVDTFPLFHYGGWHYVLEAWLAGQCVHLIGRADAAEIVDVVQRRRPSALYAIPAVWQRLLDPRFADADFTSVRHADTGTSALPAGLVDAIGRRVPQATTTVLYGATEAGRISALHHWERPTHPDSVGRPAGPVAVWVDADGEVCVSGETLMLGYLDAPEATAAVLRDGVYRTGDRGVLDSAGYLTLTGRVSELVRTGGEFVAPVEIEAVLREHPGVADVVVVGVPDATWGEVVCAVIVAHGPAPTLEDLRAHVTGRLSRHKHPRRLVVVDALPRTEATGQAQRRLIREQVLSDEEES